MLTLQTNLIFCAAKWFDNPLATGHTESALSEYDAECEHNLKLINQELKNVNSKGKEVARIIKEHGIEYFIRLWDYNIKRDHERQRKEIFEAIDRALNPR